MIFGDAQEAEKKTGQLSQSGLVCTNLEDYTREILTSLVYLFPSLPIMIIIIINLFILLLL